MQEKPRETYKILEEAHVVTEETERAHDNGSFELLEKRLFQPIFEIDYKGKTQDFKQEANEIKFTKTDLSEQERKQLGFYINKVKTDTERQGSYLDIDNWHAVDQLEYKIGETNIDIFNYLPEDYKILFCPNSEIHTGAESSGQKIIYLTSDIASLGGIATILHEVGHIKDLERLKKLSRTSFVEWQVPHKSDTYSIARSNLSL